MQMPGLTSSMQAGLVKLSKMNDCTSIARRQDAQHFMAGMKHKASITPRAWYRTESDEMLLTMASNAFRISAGRQDVDQNITCCLKYAVCCWEAIVIHAGSGAAGASAKTAATGMACLGWRLGLAAATAIAGLEAGAGSCWIRKIG